MMRATVSAMLLLAAGVTCAQAPDPFDIRACKAIETDSQRLACYDHATHRDEAPVASSEGRAATPASGVFDRDPPTARNGDGDGDWPLRRSLLDSRWELAPESKLGTFNIRSYQPIYIMPLFATSNRNEMPHSPNPNNTVGRSEPLDAIEAKFQLSFKTKIWQGVFGDAGDIWASYTQSSRWQLYNGEQSRPFRETDYEPEVMLVFNTNYRAFGWDGRLLGIGVNHQSNGRSDPLSRSWNRVIANIGFERDGWSVMLRPWWRIPESTDVDNNSDIGDYMGRAEMQLVHVSDAHEFGLLLRHSLRGGDSSHGSARFNWSFPIAGHLRGYLEVFSGYGESLIDYNHNATYLGAGVSLLDWY